MKRRFERLAGAVLLKAADGLEAAAWTLRELHERLPAARARRQADVEAVIRPRGAAGG